VEYREIEISVPDVVQSAVELPRT